MTYMLPVKPALATKEKKWAYWQGAFEQTKLDDLIKLFETYPKEQGKTFGAKEGRDLERDRNSTIAWIPADEKTLPLYNTLASIVTDINSKYFGFDLWGLAGDLQYTIYDSVTGVGGHYDWHIDGGVGIEERKLSFTIQLSDPMDYEGGEVWVHGASRDILPKQRGIILFFPSYTLHRVTPVTSGIRRSLVGWVNGPEFR